jgi:phenylacetate-CoA ligase
MHLPAVRSGGAARRKSVRPWLVSRVVLPLADRVTGRRISSRLVRLREHQWWSADQIEADTVARLRRLLDHAGTHVPFYRRLLGEAGIRAGDVRSLADLSRVPVTTKAALRAAGLEQTTADNLPAKRGWSTITSGSSGMPLQFRFDLAAEDTRLATFLLALEWAGVGVWDVEVKIGSPFRDALWRYPPASRLSLLGRRVLLGQRSCRLEVPRPTPEDLQRLVRDAVGRRAWFLRAFPSTLALIGDQLLRTGTELPTYPRAVISRGETLTAGRRATIEGAFRRPAVDHYACNEMGHVAQSCPSGSPGLHALGDRVIVHVVHDEGRPAAPGEQGRVLLTDLENEVMPFINYEVGDLATVGAPCACGRGLPLLAAVDGREYEVIRLAAGNRISALTLDACLNAGCDVGLLRQYQIVQTAPDRVLLTLVTTPQFTRRDGERLRWGFERLLGPDVTVEVAEVDDIPPEPSGKRLVVKTKVPA